MNKRIKNAQPCTFNSISFKSILEKNCYIELRRANFIVEYEPIKFILFEGIKVDKPFIHYKKGIECIETNKKLINMTWQPDFIVTNSKGNKYIVESKGKENDLFPLKLKMFRKLMESLEYKGISVINTKRDCIELVKYIKNN